MVSKICSFVFLLGLLTSCSNTSVKSLNLLISESEQNKLDSLKELSLQSKIIKEESKKYIDGSLVFESDTFNARISFKGDLKDHLRDGDESYKLKLTDTLFKEMGSFVLHRPERRRNLYEYMWHQVLNYEGLYTLHYDFIELSINNNSNGIYALEEKVNHAYLNRKGIHSWSLYRFDERGYWSDFNEDKRKTIHHYIKNAGIYKIGEVKSKRDSIGQLVQKVFDRELNASEVFNIDQTAKFLALCDVFGIEHGLVWINLRFLYNPGTGKIQFVAFDGEPGSVIKELAIVKSGALQKEANDEILYSLLSDQKIQEGYKEYLKEYSESEKLEEWQKFLTPLLNEKKRIVDQQVPGIIYSWEFVEKNQKKMRELN